MFVTCCNELLLVGDHVFPTEPGFGTGSMLVVAPKAKAPWKGTK